MPTKYLEQLTLRDLHSAFHQYYQSVIDLSPDAIISKEEDEWKRFFSIIKMYCSVVERV